MSRKTKQAGSNPLRITYEDITALKIDAKNPRLHCEKQIRQIARSIETFGFNVPVLTDASLNVAAGHGRIKGASFLGWKTVPVIRLEHLSASQRAAFAIADNRLTENSSWDDRLLGEQLKLLSEAEIDFNLEVTGFEMAEIDLYIEGLSAERKGEDDPADLVPERGPAVSSSGDLWYLGKHRLLCGDALDPANYSRLMDSKKADLVFTDPPFNVPIDGHVGGLGKHHHREFAMASGEMSDAEFTEFLKKALSNASSSSLSGSIHFVCSDWRHMAHLLAAGDAVYTELKNVCVWEKDTGGMGSLYRSQHEFVFVFKAGKSSHRNNIQLGKYGRYRTNVWKYPGANSFARSSSEGNLLQMHPTVKPVALVADAILDCSARGDLVLDPFLGSGTTIIAAERTGRVCFGLEIDPLYTDTIIRRWQKFTGQSATRDGSGESFRNLEEVANAKG